MLAAHDVPWVPEAAARLRECVTAEYPDMTETEPYVYRWMLEEWIAYEGQWETLGGEPWFVDGVRAFGLIAMTTEGTIALRSGPDERVIVGVQDGREFELDGFLAGESLPTGEDAEHSDLEGDAFWTMFYILRSHHPYGP